MTTLAIHIESLDQETAIRLFLDALHINCKAADEMGETEYLTSSPEMVKRLNEAKAQEASGEGIKMSLDDIWK